MSTIGARARKLLNRLSDADLLAAWHERRFAGRTSLELLDLFWKVQRDNPGMAGRPLYERIAARRLGSEVEGGTLAVNRADESFAQWPRERDLIFRHVVHYLVFEECIRLFDRRAGTRALIGRVVARVIPPEL
jgi:hypothetical protein